MVLSLSTCKYIGRTHKIYSKGLIASQTIARRPKMRLTQLEMATWLQLNIVQIKKSLGSSSSKHSLLFVSFDLFVEFYASYIVYRCYLTVNTSFKLVLSSKSLFYLCFIFVIRKICSSFLWLWSYQTEAVPKTNPDWKCFTTKAARSLGTVRRLNTGNCCPMSCGIGNRVACPLYVVHILRYTHSDIVIYVCSEWQGSACLLFDWSFSIKIRLNLD